MHTRRHLDHAAKVTLDHLGLGVGVVGRHARKGTAVVVVIVERAADKGLEQQVGDPGDVRGGRQLFLSRRELFAQGVVVEKDLHRRLLKPVTVCHQIKVAGVAVRVVSVCDPLPTRVTRALKPKNST